MAKFYGSIGYVKTVETDPGVHEPQTVEKEYSGDLLKNTGSYQSSGGVNDNVNMSMTVSVIADPYANENFQYMKYVVFMGAKWKILNINPQYPRIQLTVGGVYNGE